MEILTHDGLARVMSRRARITTVVLGTPGQTPETSNHSEE